MAVIEPRIVTLKNGKEVCIRPRQLEDAPAVMAYMDAIFADDRYFMTTAAEAQEWKTAELINKRTAELIENPNGLLLVTVENGRILSTSDIEGGTKIRNRHVGKVGISVLPEYSGNGLGTAIMQIMIDWAAAHPVIEKLALGVWEKNTPAIRLYEKMGFVEEGRKVREVKYADGTYDDLICMYRFVK